nr:reverse transcriptase domain-containing protein [Tanacetum cinerariifolium]
MSTRSSARNLFPPLDNPELTIQRRSCFDPTLLNNYEIAAEGNGDLPVPNLRTMEELCQPSLNGRGGPIAPIAIHATKFRLKNDMIQQVHNSCQFHGLPGDDANKHLDKFLHVTQSIKVNGGTDDAFCLYLFPHSLTHHATTWFDRLPRNSINTFEQMAKMFVGKYFPPSMVTKLRNEITNFCQNPDESLFEAWERYKLSIDRCPNHNMLLVTQIDTFYNGLTSRHRDTINAAAGGTFMKRRPEECYDLIENMTTHHNNWDTSAQQSESSSSITSSSDTKIAALKAEMAEINKNLMRVLQVNQQVKAVTSNCETCGGPHSFNDCPATIGNTQKVYAAGAYQAQQSESSSSITSSSDTKIAALKAKMAEINKNLMRVLQEPIKGANQGQNQTPAYQALVYQAPVDQPQIPQPQVVTTNEFTNFMKANDAILKNMQTNMTSLTNLNLELKNMFGQFMKMNTASSSGSGTLPVERETEMTKDSVHPTNNGSTEDVQPLVVLIESPILNSELVISPIIEPVASPVSALRPNQKPLIPYPSRLHDQKLRDKANDQRKKFFQIFMDLNFNISFTDALILMPKFGPSIKSFFTNKDKLYFDADPRVPLILKRSFLKIGRALIVVFEGELTLRVGKEAITFNLDQTLRYSANYNDMTANRIDVIDMACEEYSQEVLAKTNKSSIDEPSEVKLKDLPPHLKYAFLEGDDKLPVIIVKDLSVEEKTALITVLKSHKRAIAWKLFDIKGIDPEFCTHKILMEEDFKPAVQYHRRVNPKIYDVIKNEVLKLFNAGLIYPISDSPWVSQVHCVPKKGCFTVVENEENELILTRLITGWRVCIDYRKLNEATRKDHFPIPFMDQMLDRLARNQYYCFLDGFSGYFQIPIDPKDQEKTTFTCLYGTFAYRRMPFVLCNAPGMFQRCMLAIFHDMIEKIIEMFLDDFLVFRNSFQTCLSHLEKMLKMCEDTNLCLNWEKSHFMVKEGTVLGHKISKEMIEVDKAKVDVIAKLPHPKTVKGIRSFLGHAGFYRRLDASGKENVVNILKLIDEGPFQMGTFRETLVEGEEGAFHLAPERPRVYSNLSPKDKERFVTAVKMKRGLKESNYDQLYAYLKQHKAHINENKMMLERFTQHTVDPLALMSNVSPYQYFSQSSTTPTSTHAPPVTYQPHFADNTPLDSGLSPIDNLIENLMNTLALLTQSYKTYLP